MYVPAHFAAQDSEVRELLAHHGAADLITASASALTATLLPFVYDPTVGEHGALLGHLARNNDQWRQDWSVRPSSSSADRTPTSPPAGTPPRPSMAGSSPPGTTSQPISTGG